MGMSASGAINLLVEVIHSEGEEEISPGVWKEYEEHEAILIHVTGNTEGEREGVLSDVEWFKENYSNIGDALLWDDLPEKEGIYKIRGYLWTEHTNTTNGEDWDGGFEIEEEELLDVHGLIREVHDLAAELKRMSEPKVSEEAKRRMR